MAAFTFSCQAHGEFRKSLPKRERRVPCPQCGAESPNVVKMGTVSIVERLDNGAMARTVERLHNIEEIMNDRADKYSSGE